MRLGHILVAGVVGLAIMPSGAHARPLVGTSAQPMPGVIPARFAAQSVPSWAVRLPPDSVGTHRWPVDGGVVAVWDAPANPYVAGHRGVDLSVDPGERVRATAAGTVGFAGVVAGRAWVSVDHAHGLRTTVGPMATVAVTAGTEVTTSTALGTAAGTAHADARTRRTRRLHWSARVDGTYVDPTPLVGRLVATLLPEP